MTKIDETRMPIRPSYALEVSQAIGAASSSAASSACRMTRRASSMGIDMSRKVAMLDDGRIKCRESLNRSQS
jgi:hypothetical protein